MDENYLYHNEDSPAIRYYDLYTDFQQADLQFWVEEAQRAGGPVLELACGTGRVLLPIAEAGVEITGLDLSTGMLAQLKQKLAAAPEEVRKRVTLVQGDMRSFSLEGAFNLIFIAFNTFLLVTDTDAQRETLANIRRHVAPGGRLIIDVFDPSIPLISSYLGVRDGAVRKYREFEDPDTGHTIIIWDARSYDVHTQLITNDWTFETLDEGGRMVDRVTKRLRLRYVFRYEMQYLLELCGFRVEVLYGTYQRRPFRAGQTKAIWVATPAE